RPNLLSSFDRLSNDRLGVRHPLAELKLALECRSLRVTPMVGAEHLFHIVQVALKAVQIRKNEGQRVVDFVRHSSGQLPQCDQPIALCELMKEPLIPVYFSQSQKVLKSCS